MSKHTAVQVTKFDPTNFVANVVANSVDAPIPSEDEVLVRMDLRPIHPADIFSVVGVYPGFQPSVLPAVPGLDGMGRVEHLGRECKKLKIGQRVTAMPWSTASGNGTWQQFIVAKESQLVVVPDDIPDDYAAMIFVNPLSAIGLLDVAAVPAGEYLLVTAAGSALIRLLIPLANSKGIKVVGTVRRRDQLATFKDIGAAALVCTEDDDWPQQVRTITGGKGAYAALEAVGGKVTHGVVTATRNGGSVFIYGLMDGVEFTASGADVLFRDVRIHGFWLSPWIASLSPEHREVVMHDVWDLQRKGLFSAPVEKYFPLDQVQEALQAHVQPGRTGKIMLRG